MNRLTNLTLCLILMAALSPVNEAGADYRFGLGANYWTAVDDIGVDNFDDDGLSYYASLQIKLAALSAVEFSIEKFEAGFGGSPDDVYAPQVFFILGGGFYAGVGAGAYYIDGEFLDDPFFALRAGLNIELLPNIFLDINANHRFEQWDEINEDDVNEDTITLGAALRLEL